MDISLYLDQYTKIIIQESDIAPEIAKIVSADYNPDLGKWEVRDDIPALNKLQAQRLSYLLLNWYTLTAKLESYDLKN
jgi:hypothetical protein